MSVPSLTVGSSVFLHDNLLAISWCFAFTKSEDFLQLEQGIDVGHFRQEEW